ncbi:hypothetical protein DPMN_086239 [Dreissena polymorpha]|uniref:EGF-like domain-containing protein n=1 Tax=Dreissena polymorpha TaxID=45954 RepID=A0A9D4BMQ0_DREPO|nr:hypothetical protein DPMN_086239 [Dreissena polymorpha]
MPMQAIRVVGQQGPDYMTICEIEVYRQEDCIIGTYGPNCEQRCHCLNGPCDTLTGTCGTGCPSGWRGAACNTTCDNGWHGRDCLSRCGNCLNNTACNKTSGMCPDGCAVRYKASLCKDECENRWYGLRCQNSCGDCKDKRACNKVSGVCPGECEPGYTGTMCTDECENDWYGPDCETRCGNCRNNVTCDKISGLCPGDCEPGYYGTMCIDAAEEKTTIELSHGQLVGIILAAIATGAIFSVVAVLCLRHRRRQTSSSNNIERCQGTAVSAYDALSPTTQAIIQYDTLTMTIPPTSSECEQIPTALKKVEENRSLQLNQKTVAATYENLSPNLTTGEQQYEQFENS